MRVKVTNIAATAEVAESVRQVTLAFGERLAALATPLRDFAHVGQLVLHSSVIHPVSPRRLDRRGSYAKDQDIYFAPVEVDYLRWAMGSWEQRVDELAGGVLGAIRRIPATRLTANEREALIGETDTARLEVRAKPPPRLAAVGSVFLAYAGENSDPQVSFGSPPRGVPRGVRIVELTPDRAGEAVRPPAAEPPIFKLYRRVGGGLLYREAWVYDLSVTEHWGACGERGESRTSKVMAEAEGRAILSRLKAEAQDQGYRALAAERHARLLVEYAVDQTGDIDDLERRYALEELLDRELGWLGLGHCDGGSIGSGTMEVVCYVVDFEIAKGAVEQLLMNTEFADYRRIYRQG